MLRSLPSIPAWDERSHRTFLYRKLDGHQTRISVSSDGSVTAWTKHPHDITDKIRWLLEPFYGLPPGTQLACELYLPQHDCSSIKTAINAKDERLVLKAFSILYLEGRKASTMPCMEVEEWFNRRAVPHIAYNRWTWGKAAYDEALAWMTNAEQSFDIEGYVLKDSNMMNMCKWKPTKTIDLIVTDTKEGDGKYVGQVGALICSTKEGYEVCNASGMTDMQRLEMSCDFDPVGKVCEIEYQTVGSKGRLRHPRFKRWRDDKQPDECSAWQDTRIVEIHRGMQKDA